MPKRTYLKFFELLAYLEKLNVVKLQAALTRAKQLSATAGPLPGLTELFSPVA